MRDGVPLRNRRHVLGAIASLSALLAGLPQPAQAQEYATRRWPKDRAVPPLVSLDLDGKTWDLAALRGRAVLVNFWATWCPPCVDELPSLEDLAEQEAARLTVLAVNAREPRSTVKRFVRKAGISAIVTLTDPAQEIVQAWNVRALPTTVLIDTTGVAHQVVTGSVDWMGPQAQRWIAQLHR
jgi:thiol-disulfide isomerase/thioredoxin